MQDHGHVLARLDHLIKVADRALAHRAGQRTIDPDRLATLQQVAPDQVGGGKVVMAGDGVKRAAQPMRHRGDETGLAAAGRAFQQDRQFTRRGGEEDIAFVALRQVEGGVSRPLQVEGSVHLHHSAAT